MKPRDWLITKNKIDCLVDGPSCVAERVIEYSAYAEIKAERDQWEKHYEARSTWVPDIDLLMEDLREALDQNKIMREALEYLTADSDNVFFQLNEGIKLAREALAKCGSTEPTDKV